MHRSRLAGLIIDCDTDDLEAAGRFWSEAFGVLTKPGIDASYVMLDMPAGEPHVEVQKVDHPSRVHVDIEADDIKAEVARLEALGAKKIADVKSWCVMEAPTGQRFCVVPAESAVFDEKAHRWP
jgi:predicted enzyme related to lactoylglutathione lyase